MVYDSQAFHSSRHDNKSRLDSTQALRCDKVSRPAVLLVNLGTPQSPAPKHVRVFLRRFLSDKRVIEMPRVLWKLILEGIILRARPKESGELYAQIWGEKAGEGVEGSPLMHWSRAQEKALQERLNDEADVYLAMRYSDPDVPSMLDLIARNGHERVLLMPLYAHYSQSTVASVIDEAAHWLLRTRNQMEIRTLRSFPEDPLYIESIATAIEKVWSEKGRPNFAAGERLLFSYHSIPVAMRDAGDPYISECEATSRALVQRLGLELGGAITTYQSIFGKAEWVGPATIDTVRELGKHGCTRVDIVCPAFLTDCLETLHEINILNREEFVHAGGRSEAFTYIPFANAQPTFLDALEHQARLRLAGWV